MPEATLKFSALDFVQMHLTEYRRLWKLLGRTWSDLQTEAAWANEAIRGTHHGATNLKLTDEQRGAAMVHLGHMGFFDETLPPQGRYDELVVTGAKFHAMVGRWVHARELLEKKTEEGKPEFVFDRITCLFGQRPREDKLDGTLDEILATLSPAVLRHFWVRNELEKPHSGELYEGPFATEFELGLLAILVAYDGQVNFGDFVACYERPYKDSPLEGVPQRYLESWTLYLSDDPYTWTLVLNAPAVERPNRPPRPTTDSTTAYWFDHYPPKQGSQLVMAFGPTHWFRQASDAENRLRIKLGRPDLRFHALSRKTDDPMAVLNNALSEAAILLHNAAAEEAAQSA